MRRVRRALAQIENAGEVGRDHKEIGDMDSTHRCLDMGLVASPAAGKHGATGRDGAFMGLGVEKLIG
jgi:hypothetical protein